MTSRERHRAAVVALVLLACPGELRAQGQTGVLPVAGAADLDRALERALDERCGSTVLGATPTLSRIARGRAGAALDELRRKVERAEDATVQMKRAAAVSASREAVEGLQAIAAGQHAPALLARAWLARGLALMLRPADEEGVLAAFRAASGIDPGTRPDPDHLPPRAARLLERARAKPLPAPAPTASQLAVLAESAGLAKIAWGTLAGDSGAEVQVLVYDAETRTLRSGARPLRADRSELARSVIQAGALCPVRPAAVVVPVRRPIARPVALDPASRPEEPKRTGAPWYRRWWVWGIAGAVLVGSGVAVAVAATRGARYELRFKY